MQEYGYFQKALADFTHEAASGGAIRHLTDMGYTVKQIMAQLDFPTPYERVQKGVWERLLETGVILTEEPGSGGRYGEGILRRDVSVQKEGMSCRDEPTQRDENLRQEDYLQKRRKPGKKVTYVREYDQYGKASFRRVEEAQEEEAMICWKEYHWENGVHRLDGLFALLREKRQKNGETRSYMSCDFGVAAWREPEKFQAMMDVLQERQREYLSGLPWERCRLYHRLDSRMMEILRRFCEEGMYQGECFFMETKDRIIF